MFSCALSVREQCERIIEAQGVIYAEAAVAEEVGVLEVDADMDVFVVAVAVADALAVAGVATVIESAVTAPARLSIRWAGTRRVIGTDSGASTRNICQA